MNANFPWKVPKFEPIFDEGNDTGRERGGLHSCRDFPTGP